MTDEVGQDSAIETPQAEAPQVQTPEALVENSPTDQEQSDGHPAWNPIREALGDILFHKIKPNLKEFDDNAQKRITELNSKYEPWKAFEQEQVTPDLVRRAIGLMRDIDSNPLQIHQRLGEFLQAQGLLNPTNQTEQPVEEDDGEDPRDKALRELQEQQEQLQQFLQMQEQAARQAEYDRQADAALEAEITALRKARPDLTREDEGQMLRQYALYVQSGNYDMTLEKVAAEFDATRNRILTQPRPNDLAPRIPGSGGTAPTGNPLQAKPEEYSREQSQAYLAELLRKAKQ